MIDGLYGPSALAEEHDKGLLIGFLLGVLLSCMFIIVAHAIKLSSYTSAPCWPWM